MGGGGWIEILDPQESRLCQTCVNIRNPDFCGKCKDNEHNPEDNSNFEKLGPGTKSKVQVQVQVKLAQSISLN